MAEKDKQPNLHAGHRARVRKKILRGGYEALDDHEVLEMLLYYSIPRGDTNATAHRLLDRFRTMKQLLEATPEELMAVEGVGENTALLLTMVPELLRRYSQARLVKRVRLITTEALGEFLLPIFIGRREECVFMLCLDKNRYAIWSRVIHVGNANTAAIYIPKIIAHATAVNAAYVVLAHNHPEGFAAPSQVDIRTTYDIAAALRAVNITLLDHIVVSEPTDPAAPVGDYVSLADSNLFQYEDEG